MRNEMVFFYSFVHCLCALHLLHLLLPFIFVVHCCCCHPRIVLCVGKVRIKFRSMKPKCYQEREKKSKPYGSTEDMGMMMMMVVLSKTSLLISFRASNDS